MCLYWHILKVLILYERTFIFLVQTQMNRCRAITNRGVRCNRVVYDEDYCWQHEPADDEKSVLTKI